MHDGISTLMEILLRWWNTFVLFDTLNPICINIVSYSRTYLLLSLIRIFQFDTNTNLETFSIFNGLKCYVLIICGLFPSVVLGVFHAAWSLDWRLDCVILLIKLSNGISSTSRHFGLFFSHLELSKQSQ